MKNAIKRLLGMALSLCVMASTFAIPTAYAQENQQGEGQATPQDDPVQTISEVSINGIVTPVIDSNTNDFVTSVGVSEEAAYKIDSKNLFKADTTDAADTTFVKDQKYDLVIVLSAKDVNTAKFSDNADDVTVNVGNKSIADGKLTVTVEDIQAVYSVKLNHNYGDPATVESKLTDASYKLSEADLTVSRDGWELKGWNTLADGNGTEITKDTVFDGSVTEIFAIWEEVKTIDIEITGVTEPKFNEAPTVEGITITSGYKAEYKWLIKDGENWKDNTDTAFGHGAQYALQAVITLDENASAAVLDTDKSVSVNGTEYTATPANNSLTVIHPFDVLAHSPQKVEKNDSTCKEFGKAEHWKCECGVLFSDEEGKTVVTEDQLKIEKKEHIPEEEWTVDKEPTTSSQGHRYKKCTKCGDVVAEENIASLISNVEYEFICVHADTTTHGAYPATCTSNGYTGNVACSWCGQVMSMGKTIPAIGHNYVNGICKNCGHVYGNISSGGSSNSGSTGSGSGNWIPQTGDESQPMIYIALIILSVMGIASVCVFGKKRRTSKR